MTPQQWMQIAGLGTWFVVSLPAIAAAVAGTLAGPLLWLWLAAFFGFGLTFVLTCRLEGRSHARDLTLLALQTAFALTLTTVRGDGLAAATLVVVAGQLLWVIDLNRALLWVALQTALLVPIFLQRGGVIAAVSVASAYGGFQLFALATSALALRERRGAEALARANAELSATRELLVENSRVAERLRISRDLHDTLGHHLTALSLQLDVASRLANEPATGHIAQAHAIARLLLSDVRDAVSRLRDQGRVNILPLLRDLAAGTSKPSVHLDVPDDLDFEDPGQAHALLSAVQEIMTNAVKHSRATHLWITITRDRGGVAMHARDDGRGAREPVFGNGLTGMRERLAEYHGTVDITSAPGEGFSIRAFLPAPEPPP